MRKGIFVVLFLMLCAFTSEYSNIVLEEGERTAVVVNGRVIFFNKFSEVEAVYVPIGDFLDQFLAKEETDTVKIQD